MHMSRGPEGYTITPTFACDIGWNVFEALLADLKHLEDSPSAKHLRPVEKACDRNNKRTPAGRANKEGRAQLLYSSIAQTPPKDATNVSMASVNKKVIL